MTEIRFSVHGQPKTAGSKAAFAFIGKDGKPHATVTDDTGEAGKSWRSIVVSSARRAHLGPLLDGPLVLDVTFRFLRPGDHFGRRGGAPYLKPTAPTYHSVKPDATKLLRALEDALTGVVWRDDSRIVVQRVRKVYAETAGADVRISSAPPAGLPAGVAEITAEAEQPLLLAPEPASAAPVVDTGLMCRCGMCVEERARGLRV